MAPTERSVIVHNDAQVGFDVARGVENLGAGDCVRGVVEGVEHDGEVGFQGDEVEAALPLRDA